MKRKPLCFYPLGEWGKRSYTMLLLLLVFTAFARATHVRSGEITYVNLGNGTYLVTATVYYDCDEESIQPEFSLQLGVYGVTSGIRLASDVLPKVSEEQLSEDELVDWCYCGSGDDLPCVIKSVYRDTVHVPMLGGMTNPNGSEAIEFVINLGARNEPIDNLLYQGGNFSIRTEAPDTADIGYNRSPVFSGPGLKAVCQQEGCISLGGIDPDFPNSNSSLNRLEYHLTDPMAGYAPPSYFDTLDLATGFSATNFLGPNGNVVLDPFSGNLCFDAGAVAPGTYLFSVEVDEYMEDPSNPGNSILVGTTTRDFQLEVLSTCPCCPVTADFTTATTICSGELTGFFGAANDSCPGQVSHYWDFGDGGNRYFVENASNVYSGAGTYTARHITDNGCAIDTVEVTINVANCCLNGYYTDNYVDNGLFNDSVDCGVPSFTSFMIDDCGTASLADNNYALVKFASEGDASWVGSDNSGLDSLFFLGNGNMSSRMAWQQSVYIGSPNSYSFCVDVKNVCPTCPGEPRFRLWANGSVIFTSNDIPFSNGWDTICGNFGVSASGTITLGIEILGDPQAGNVFGLDNIRLRVACNTISIPKNAVDETNQAALELKEYIYPNPVQNGQSLIVEYSSRAAEQVFVSLSDLRGKILWVRQVQVQEGANAMSVKMEGVSGGVYHINVTSATATSSYKVMVTD